MQVIRPWLCGQFGLLDLVDALRRSVQPPTLPETEPATPEPVTPLEQLVLEATAHGLELVDYRDLKAWPRKHVYDWREYGWPGDKSRAQPYGTRPWSKFSAICLHTFDAHRMGPKRFLGVPAHAGIAGDATPVLMHDLWRIVGHARGLNAFAAGIEFSGRSSLDVPLQAELGRAMVRYMVDERERNIDPTQHPGAMAIYGHFMATKGKPKCPGDAIMREVGEWAIDELGLLPGVPLRTGLPWKRGVVA